MKIARKTFVLASGLLLTASAFGFFKLVVAVVLIEDLWSKGLYQKKYPNAETVNSKPLANTKVLWAIFMKVLLGIDS